MLPADAKAQRAKPIGFQSGTTEERRGNNKVKTTKMSWKDMAKRAIAGHDTSIKAT